MKKSLLVILGVVALLILSSSLAFAKTEKVNLTGEIKAVDTENHTITILTAESEEITIQFPPEWNFTFSQDDVGIFVHIKGEYQEDGSLVVEWVKPVDEQMSAYCSGENETAHPVAIVLANKFDKDVDEIMDYFCQGFGFGQIFLALQTEMVTGGEVLYSDLLASRAEGQGWGEIWKDLGYHGKPKDPDKTPPGQEKDKDQDKTPPGQEKDKDNDKTPPGQEKDKDQDKTPPGQEKAKEKKPKKN